MKILVMCFAFYSIFTSASEQFEVITIEKVEEFIDSGKYPPGLLVVFDLDNTVFAMDQNFGSDQWFDWQRSLLGTDNKDLLAKDFEDLLELQNIIFSLSHMHLVEEETFLLIEKLQSKNIPVVALTSRSPAMRNNTERELTRLNVDFSRNLIATDFRVIFKRLTTFQNGIYMTSGQNKGEMLKFLIQQSSRKFKTIVFIDDHKKHTDNVFRSFKDSGTDIFTFRYGYEDLNVDRFIHSNKYKARKYGSELLSLINSLR